MCFLISRNAILGFRKNMSQCLKEFQGNLNTTIIKNSPDWFRNSLNVRDYCKTFHSGITLSPVKGFAIVPYIQGIADPIRRVLNNCGIKVSLKPFQTLGHIFVKPKDRVPTHQKTHAVYSIPCGDCEKVYLGQTKRQFCTRLKEHQRAVSNFKSSKSALAEHVCEASHNIAWEDSKVITTNNPYGQRLCLEAWHINASPCALNRDDGSHLPREYLHLVGK